MPLPRSAPTRRGCSIYHLQDAAAGVSIPAGVLTAALGGYLLGRLVLRMRTIYLSIATWAFAETLSHLSRPPPTSSPAAIWA